MEYQPPDTTGWRDVSAQRARERHDQRFAVVVLISVLFPALACFAAAEFMGPVPAFLVFVGLTCWRSL